MVFFLLLLHSLLLHISLFTFSFSLLLPSTWFYSLSRVVFSFKCAFVGLLSISVAECVCVFKMFFIHSGGITHCLGFSVTQYLADKITILNRNQWLAFSSQSSSHTCWLRRFLAVCLCVCVLHCIATACNLQFEKIGQIVNATETELKNEWNNNNNKITHTYTPPSTKRRGLLLSQAVMPVEVSSTHQGKYHRLSQFHNRFKRSNDSVNRITSI